MQMQSIFDRHEAFNKLAIKLFGAAELCKMRGEMQNSIALQERAQYALSLSRDHLLDIIDRGGMRETFEAIKDYNKSHRL